MSCLQGYIGVNAPGMPESVSGLYINELPGISLKSLDKVANEDDQTFYNVWQKIEKRGIQKLFSDIAFEFSSRYSIKRVTRSIDFGNIVTQPVQTYNPAAQLRGFSIELRLASWYKPSSLQSISVQSLSIYLLAAQTSVVIKVIDIETNNLLDTFTVNNAVEGWNTIQVNKKYAVQRLFVGYDATNIESVDFQIINPIGTFALQTINEIYGWGNAEGYVRGAETFNPAYIPQGLNYGYNTYGLSGVLSLVCSWDNFICKNIELWGQPLLYLLGKELMIEAIASTRFNWITMEKERLNELKNYFDTEYNQALTNVLKGLSIDTADWCIQCDAPIQVHDTVL